MDKKEQLIAQRNISDFDSFLVENRKLINEQFKAGLKNIVDLLQARDNLLQAQQNKLQSKYTTILNTQLLRFYEGGELGL